ncbi:B3 domain-containing protein REM5-like [Prunus yedoensis var. nudiflora]|uniref:B3 domain-containing protein REM5-like n=1 Tax=Prunus yedoensis var. nudiflora TaxID=2094558 RepID=A0A314UEQ3_PRUYE|nr:B3 domain-containing protein REM5-like [Prunus yedoensis var. nudiflora]
MKRNEQSSQSAAVTSQQNPKKHSGFSSCLFLLLVASSLPLGMLGIVISSNRGANGENISKNEEKKHSFFKLHAGFNTDCVRIPPKFLKHMSKDLSERATLKLKNSSDSSWTVKVKKIREGAVYFKNGWEEFIRDNSLGTDNEMLTIFYEGNMHFSIRIFGENGIERTEELSKEEDSEDSTSEDLEGVEPEAFKSNFPYFEGIINKTKCQFIPTAFSREHFPEGKGFKAILKNAEGEKWTVKGIPHFPQSHNFSEGWSEFVSANQIRIGDTCIFELLSRYQMTVHILRKR